MDLGVSYVFVLSLLSSQKVKAGLLKQVKHANSKAKSVIDRHILDRARCALRLKVHQIIDMVAERNKQIEEQLAPHFHLHLHGAATLECLPAADNQSQVMSAKAGVAVRRVLIGIPSTAQDDADLDSALQALLAQGQALELFEAITLSRTVHSCVSEEIVAHAGVEESCLDSTTYATAIEVW